MKKILIIGISGTGKSTLSLKLSSILNIPLFHYDTHCWNNNWIQENEEIVKQKILKMLSEDQCILEGYIEPASKERLEWADRIIYLDYSGLQAAIGGIQRWWKYRGRKRPEMADGCIEKLDWNHLRVMFGRHERKEIEKVIVGYEYKILRLKSRKETNSFLSTLIQE